MRKRSGAWVDLQHSLPFPQRQSSRDPREIERTVGINATELDDEGMVEAYLEAGADHLILMTGAQGAFDLSALERLLALRD